MIKWRDVEEKLGQKRRGAEDTYSVGRAAPRPRLMLPESVTHSDCNTQAVDDGNTWLDEPHELDPGAVSAERRMFTLGGRSDINIHAPYLQDILNDVDSTVAQGNTGRSKQASTSLAVANKALPASADWEIWD